MKIAIVLSTVALLASLAAAYIVVGPKIDWDSAMARVDPVDTTDFVSIPVKKKPRKRTFDLDELLHDYPQAKPKKVSYVLPPIDNNRAQVHAPIVFNELMVKTAFTFAQRKGQCQKRTCIEKLQQPSEQQRIYAKILQQAHTGCNRRQLDACEIKGDILAAERQFQLARETVDIGANLAKSVLSRCESGLETETARCTEAASRHESMVRKSKSIYSLMLNAH